MLLALLTFLSAIKAPEMTFKKTSVFKIAECLKSSTEAIKIETPIREKKRELSFREKKNCLAAICPVIYNCELANYWNVTVSRFGVNLIYGLGMSFLVL